MPLMTMGKPLTTINASLRSHTDLADLAIKVILSVYRNDIGLGLLLNLGHRCVSYMVSREFWGCDRAEFANLFLK